MIIKCLGVYNNFKLVNKPEPENTIAQKKKCMNILTQMK